MSDHTTPRRSARITAARFAKALHPALPDTDRATLLAILAADLNGTPAGEKARRAATCYADAAHTSDPAHAAQLRTLGRAAARQITTR